jgi:hypothetical protein
MIDGPTWEIGRVKGSMEEVCAVVECSQSTYLLGGPSNLRLLQALPRMLAGSQAMMFCLLPCLQCFLLDHLVP